MFKAVNVEYLLPTGGRFVTGLMDIHDSSYICTSHVSDRNGLLCGARRIIEGMGNLYFAIVPAFKGNCVCLGGGGMICVRICCTERYTQMDPS